MITVTTRNTLIRTICVHVFFAAVLLASAAQAQVSNIEVYQRLALECLAEAPLSDTVRVQPEDVPAYIRSAVTTHWLDDRGVVLYEAENGDRPLSVISYRVESPRISYGRHDDGIERSGSLTTHYSVRSDDGRLIQDRRCERTYSDVVERRMLPLLENSDYPETMATAPPRSWRRRYLEPALVASATAVSVFLFFALRSKSTSSE